MEVFLLLFDELEDTAYTLVHVWARLCRACLAVGLVSSVTLLASRFFVIGLNWVVLSAIVAVTCVCLWVLTLAVSLFGTVRENASIA
jgi:membrane protein YdbS with pleckstrin-like domain